MAFDSRSKHRAGLSARLAIVICLLPMLGGLVCVNAEDQPTREALDHFESKVRPVLISRCAECHNAENPESGLSVQSRDSLLRGGKLGPALVPGKPKESLLISAVNHDEFLKMPPKDKLSTAELVALSQWVTMGAPWPAAENSEALTAVSSKSSTSRTKSAANGPSEEQKNFWSFQPLRLVAPPILPGLDVQPQPIDAFVLQKLIEQQLQPAPLAGKRELIRRATYDLLGLPPTEEEINRFVSDDSPDAYSRLLDRLLASPRYGERWGRHWLDVARFADSNGLDENIAYANAFRYRDYVIHSLNCDKPFDRFLQEQVAGDLLPFDERRDASQGEPFDRYIATGFLAIGAKMLAEDDPVKMQMDIIDEQLTTLCQAFMGLTIGCARCHDHKYDPLPTTDYYALAGIFKSTQTMENHRVVARWYERPLASEAEAARVKEIDAALKQHKEQLAELDKKCRQRLSGELRKSVAQHLVAVSQWQAFNQAWLDQREAGLVQAMDSYVLRDGYVLIEAEGFQRGSATREVASYGKDIGVLLTHGPASVEYDVEVQQAGTYVLELRHAAQSPRPLRLWLDEKLITNSAAGEATGGWNAEHQRWSIAASFELAEGKHVIKLDSDAVFPHVDQLALVLKADSSSTGREIRALVRLPGWNASAPESLQAMVSLWSTYLDGLIKRRDNSDTAQQFWSVWLEFGLFTQTSSAGKSNDAAAIAPVDREAALASRLNDWLEGNAAVPGVLRHELKLKAVHSRQQLAEALQTVVTLLVEEGADGPNQLLRSALLKQGSPLQGPRDGLDRFYTTQEREAANQLRTAMKTAEADRPKVPSAMGVTEAKPEDLKVHLRGSHLVLGETVPRRFPTILTSARSPQIDSEKSGRLQLAQWMSRPDHPLTSRVIVNRLWHWHFGRGIVPSVDNFGILGLPPSHPELLDWLASELIAGDWSIKQMHKRIMLSETYQRSTAHVAASAQQDPENQWLWRFRRRRLTAEETRDSILAVGAGVDHQMYGSLMKVENHSYVNSTGGRGAVDYEQPRRTVYLPIIRSGVFDVLQTLDFPDPAMISGQRQTSTVAPQALLMMNSDLVRQQAEFIATELETRALDDAAAISAIYHRILKRAPSIDEIVASATFLRDSQAQSPPVSKRDGWLGLSRVLISSNEFSYID